MLQTIKGFSMVSPELILLSRREIGERMGGVEYGWVSRMQSELKQQNAAVKKLFECVEAVLTQK